MVSSLQTQPRVAVDTESNSLHAYRERVCLIQFSIPTADYLVDPLALSDLAPLGPFFAAADVEKVFHAAEYDLMCLKRDFGFACRRLFDTRVASRTLGWPQDGLGDLLLQQFGLQLDKRHQRSDWGQRPLPPGLLDYARLDTHYLLELRDRLAEALRRAGRWEEACEEFVRLEQVEAHCNGFDPDGYWRIATAGKLSPPQVAVLQQLYLLREDLARAADRPPFKVMGNQTLLAVAQAAPMTLDALATLPGMTDRQIQRYGEPLLAAVHRGLRMPPPQPPAHERIEDDVLARYDALRLWRKRAAEAHQVESDVILPREVLWEIARRAPHNAEELKQIMTPLLWRHQAYGREILRVLSG